MIISDRLFNFVGSNQGSWKVLETKTIIGASLEVVTHLEILPGMIEPNCQWNLKGMVSNERYVTRSEKVELVVKQEALGRPTSLYGALIPIRKNPAWWALTQDERRQIFEESSNHIRIGLKFLPAIARKLHHCRDLEEHQPFDFLTWFEFSKADSGAFDDLLAALRASPEWKFIDREVEIRVEKMEKY
jgi:hypothetical protein